MAGADKAKRAKVTGGPTARRRTVLAGGAVAAFWPIGAQAATATTLRLHDHNTHTRLVVELTGSVDFKLRRFAEPYRLAIDLPSLDWAVSDGSAPATGLISSVRYGVQTAGAGRISIDLTGPVKVARSFVLPATAATPTRLVIDLEPATKEAFMAAVEVKPAKMTMAETRPAASAQPVPTKAAATAKTPQPNKADAGKKIVAIDAGHGGIDPGAIGLSGIYEKHITLAAALQLKTRLEGTNRYKVMLTRSEDDSLALRQRTELARQAQADIFISLHADSIVDKSIRGLSVYTLAERASDAEAEALAAHENKADRIIGMDLSHETAEVRNILVDLAQRESRNLASRLATRLIGELQREVHLLPNSHRFASFAVLKSPDIPSVLIEMGYLSNAKDEGDLKKEPYRAKLMTAIVRGLDLYFGGTQIARQM